MAGYEVGCMDGWVMGLDISVVGCWFDCLTVLWLGSRYWVFILANGLVLACFFG